MTESSLTQLLEVWQSWSYRDLLTGAIASASFDGDTDRADQLGLALAQEPDVAPLDALAASHRLTRLLRGWQWHAIRPAREAGTSWEQIGVALGTTAEQARAGYLDSIELAERHGLTDTTPYRAVLDDPSPAADRSSVADRSLVAGLSSEAHRPLLGGGPAHRPGSAVAQPPAVRSGRGGRR